MRCVGGPLQTQDCLKVHPEYIPAPVVGLVADPGYSEEKGLPLQKEHTHHSPDFESDTLGAYKMQIPILSQQGWAGP